MSYNGYPKWDKNRGRNFQIGMIITLLICIGLFNINAKIVAHQPELTNDLDDTFITSIPPTVHKKKKVVTPSPPKPKSLIKKIVFDDIIEKPDTPETVDSLQIEEPDKFSPVVTSKKAPEVLVQPQETPSDEPLIFVEHMPTFGQCIMIDKIAKRECSDQALLSYIYKHLKYPTIARENGIEGLVFIEFIVNKEGAIERTKVLKDIGGGCGLAAKKNPRQYAQMDTRKTKCKTRKCNF